VLGILCISLSTVAATPAGTEQTLWLVQSLYPGQERFVDRTEAAIHQMMPKDETSTQVVGRKELTAALTGKSVNLKCLFGEAPCGDPIDDMVSGLGFERIVLIKGGQDEGGYRFQISSYRPSAGEVTTADGAHAVLEHALLAALVKIVPLASSLEVISRPPGATVFVDGEKVGSTPLSGQILPGERKIKLELGGYRTVESTQSVPVRGRVAVQRDLEKMPARLILSAFPAGADISVDGKSVGKDKVDQGIMPGRHTIRFAAPGYMTYEVVADIKANETYNHGKALTPTGWQSTKLSMEVAQEDIYKRSLSLVVAFETQTLTSSDLNVQSPRSGSSARVQKLLTPSPGSARLIGASAELSTHGRYFGLMIVGAAYLRSTNAWQSQVANPDPGLPATVTTDVDLLSVRLLQPQLRVALWRFTFSLQLGAELRAFRMRDRASPQMYPDGFVSIDTQLIGQAALRAFLVEGLFLEGAFRYHYTIVGIYGGKGPSTLGLRGGIGYAF